MTIVEFGFLAVVVLLVAHLSVRVRHFSRFICRKLIYDNLVVRILRNRFLGLVVPSVATTYYICLDIWAERWPVIKNNIEIHEAIFAILVAASLLLLTIRAFADLYEGGNRSERAIFVDRLTLLTSRLVKNKLERFKELASQLTPSGNTFSRIAQPNEQINLALSELVALLLNQFGVKESNQRITVMRLDPRDKKWHFIYDTNKSWKHTNPNELMEKQSAARLCLETGEPQFHADKKVAARNGEYCLTERDNRHGGGSVFCYPVTVENRDYKDQYVISMITYGVVLCDVFDREYCEAIDTVLRDVCRRIELELSLESIKFWQYEFHSNSTRRST